MHRHLWVSVAAVVAALATIFAAVGVAPAPAAAPKAGKGRLVVVLKAPRGVDVQALVRGTGLRVVKPGTSRKQVTRLKVRSGSYRVSALQTTALGQTWAAQQRVRSVQVRKGRTTRLVLTWRKVAAPVRTQVTATSSTSVTLGWRARKASAYVVRRSTGEQAPRSRNDGTKVDVGRTPSVTDANLAPGTTYTYAVFAKTRKKGWTTPATVTTATLPAVSPGAASYALLPHAVVVEPGDTDVVSVVAGQVWVAPAASRPAPVLGAGMALPVSAALPGGFLGVVAEIAPDGRTVRLEQAGLNEVFSFYDLDASLDEVVDEAPLTARSSAPALKPSAPSKKAGARGASGKGSTQARAARVPSCLDYTTGQLKVSVDPSLAVRGRLRARVESSWGIPRAVTLDTDVAITATMKMDLEVGQQLACSFTLNRFAKTFTTTPVPISLLWEAEATVAAQGAIKVHGLGNTATASFGATARIGSSPSFTPRSSITGDLLNPTGEGAAEASAAIGGSVTVGPGVTSPVVGAIAGIGGTLDLFKASAKGAFGINDGSSCLQISAETAASLRLYASAWGGPFSAEAEWPLWEGSQPWGSRTWPVGCDQVDPTLGAGDVQATLTWSNGDDMDLHVVDPAGEEIWYQEPSSLSGGELDHDQIPDCDSTLTGLPNAENIYWPAGGSPAGVYTVWVDEYNDCSSVDASWTLTVRVDGVVVLRRTGSGTSPTYSFTNG